MKTKSPARLDLPKALDSGSFEHAVILTYTFDPLFFEDYCLANLEGLHNCKSISVCLDRTTYDTILAGSHAERPKQANLRYLLHPIRVPGVFHPKLVLLTSSTKGRLIIGSANFTRPGLTANAELVAAYDFKANDKEEFAPVFRSAFALIKTISERWPARNLISNLEEMQRDSPWLENIDRKNDAVSLISNLDIPLLSQLVSKTNGAVTSVSLVSRYFDETPRVVEEMLKQTAARQVTIFTQNRCTNLPSSWLQHRLFKGGQLQIYLSDYSSDDRDQPLHGKLIAMHTSDGCLVAFGSANCTTPALLKSSNQSNVEALVTVRMSAREARVLLPRMLDPEGNACQLTAPSELVSVPIEQNDGGGEKFPIEIKEAEADQTRILIWLEQPLKLSGLRAKVEFPAGRFVRIPVKRVDSTEIGVEIEEEVAKRLGQSPAILGFEDAAGTPVSNRIFVTNLMDVQTGTSVRKARFIKEAEQNAAGLLSVLHDLRAGSNEDALRTFLTFCDIPLILGPRPTWRPLAKNAGEGHEGMRTLGQHDFKVALTLHELALSFCERHFRKLRRHSADRRPDGIPNFLHIALAIGGVLESQINRALSGLEARDRVTTEEWSSFRDICDTYFLKYRELATLTWESYLSKLIREFPTKRIREEFEPELQPLEDLAGQMLRFRRRVETLRVTKCLMQRSDKKNIPFEYFQSIFGEQRWLKYEKEMKALNSLIASAVTGEPRQLDRPHVGSVN
jgi:hypothetical protein